VVEKRDLYWDTLKFVLIFFVVYAHSVSTFAPNESFNRATYNLINVIVMPLFIFISGKFSQLKDRNKYKYGILHIFETYIVFQFIRAFMPILFGKTLTLYSIVSFLVNPKYTLWYLLCIVYWRLLVLMIPPKLLNNRPILILVSCFVVSIFGGFLPVKGLSLHRAMTFLPFFFMGYYSNKINLKKNISKMNVGISFVVLLCSFLFIHYFLNTNLNFILHGKNSYWINTSLTPMMQCLAKCAWLVFAIILGFMTMSMVRVQSTMAKMGRATLGIYIYHSFIIEGMRALAKQGILPGNEMMLFFYAVVITIGLAYLSKFKLYNFLLNPITYKERK
jgi:fucose 4-O-acetylase-like acetyltransferase